MKYLHRIFFLIVSLLPVLTFAQDADMADAFRSEGKIYVVIAGMVIILVGLFLYLFSLGKKVSDLEKKIAGKD